jgi:chromatin modification-related protein YNG2
VYTELLQDVAKESAKYIRHSSRGGVANPKDADIPQTVKETYIKIDQIADEKLLLAQRVVDLIARARTRLDHDLARVLVQQGEDPGSQPNVTPVLPKKNAVQEIRESLRSVLVREATPVPSSVAGAIVSNKRSLLSLDSLFYSDEKSRMFSYLFQDVRLQ